ncbi:hypothetical protein JTE90_028271 [Oedothorax gibbosus]|uniref:Uncharacterized protein n=1 Tax=Oedothorax gibbosus TaxID=931172 RepID=A0AAV6UBJ9_9ARAC|nr:hypothetical protein JTE90_028271 [Oedothorax gibbosus]
MTENASHVVVHHHFDNTSGEKLINMTCCIVLSVAIVLILLIIILAIIIYMVFRRKKRNIPTDASGSNLNKVDLSNVRRGISNPAASFDDNEIDINSNRQNIPMSMFRVNSGNMRADVSDSSAGLCEVLFPQQHQGEVIRDPPPKVVAYAGRIYSTARRPSSPQTSNISKRHSRQNSPPSKETFRRCPQPNPQQPLEFSGCPQPNPQQPLEFSTCPLPNSDQPVELSGCPRTESPPPSGSETRRDTGLSLEWDYTESRQYETSNDSETDVRDTVNICWV